MFTQLPRGRRKRAVNNSGVTLVAALSFVTDFLRFFFIIQEGSLGFHRLGPAFTCINSKAYALSNSHVLQSEEIPASLRRSFHSPRGFHPISNYMDKSSSLRVKLKYVHRSVLFAGIVGKNTMCLASKCLPLSCIYLKT